MQHFKVRKIKKSSHHSFVFPFSYQTETEKPRNYLRRSTRVAPTRIRREVSREKGTGFRRTMANGSIETPAESKVSKT